MLTSAYVADYRVRTVTYTNDMSGEVIRRDEADALTTKGDPLAVRYRFNGREMNYTTNNSGSNAPLDYAAFGQLDANIRLRP